MYLKSIEIQGFKSFANKIVFDFHNGITGIVGPNGSGKSNVADAVRWVLGEQKVKQLRSSSMQDVIFAGTENRKPLSYAYVAITLDNSDHQLNLDYNEVTVARRVYRSGESEYLLNGTQCRLRDINELFYDTGIGKEGYSIIGQGQIDKILSGKPEERRELFDEAAGIVKYKRRKLTTQKKLENEQQNLLRVTDILTELERQVGPLERQSEQAKTYLKKKEELKVYDVNLFLTEMERMQAEQKSVEEKYEIADNQMRETTAVHEQTKLRYEELETAIAESDQRIGILQQQISDADLEREKTEGDIRLLQEQIHSVEQGQAHFQERMDELEADVSKRQALGEQYTDDKARLDRNLEEVKTELNQLLEKRDLQQAEAERLVGEIEHGKQEILDLLGDRAAMKAEQQKFDTMLEQADVHRAQLNSRLLTHQSTESNVEEQLQESRNHLDELNEQILSLEKKKIKTDQDRRQWRSQEDELRKKMDELRQAYHRDASRLETMKNISERYDGYGNSIRRVMERKKDIPGILGVVADLIQVDKRYEIAIETALGGSIQNIVTDNENTAKRMIAYLKEKRFGRATFLPLTSVSAPENVPAKKALGEAGVIGLADGLVKTEERYRGVAGHLLGRVLVVDTIDHAIAIAKKFRYSLRIVTLEGESLQPGGSMTGGAFKNNSNLLGRSREIEALEKKVQEYATQNAKLKDRLEDVCTASELLKEDLEEMQETLQDWYLRQNTLQVEVEHLESQKEEQEQFYRSIQQEMAEIDTDKQKIGSDKTRILDRLKASENREKEIKRQEASLQDQLGEARRGLADLEQEAADTRLRQAQVEQQVEFARENIQRVAEEILTLHQSQQEILLTSSNSHQIIEEKEIRIGELTEQSAALIGRKETDTAALSGEMNRKEEMSKEQKGFFERREACATEISQLDKEIYRLNDQREKLERAIENLTNYMWEEYELTLHLAKEMRQETEYTPQELKLLIQNVKEEIRKLGNVNVNAIEEYREVSERYAFLHTQHEDLLEAEKNLKDIIADLEEGMRKQFAEKFADIQKEFDRAFSELFGGGKGSLELAIDEETTDLLDCGINIIAQPPGKKLQNMMQMSGGEKALTAIALLFAIQNLKPSPFCLLDEIEAALDDSNVDRYARYLHKLTKNTQFIVITHRRGTMVAADRLFGITMQEKGVSTLVSVNLIENELDA